MRAADGLTGSYVRVKAKCLRCSLHFVLCTWQPEKHSAATLYCPQCGQHDGEFITWREQVVGMIANEVPGSASVD